VASQKILLADSMMLYIPLLFLMLEPERRNNGHWRTQDPPATARQQELSVLPGVTMAVTSHHYEKHYV